MKLSAIKLGLTLGIIWGLYVLFIGWVAAIGWGNHNLVHAMSGLYVGFKSTLLGGIIGGLWGFVDGFIGGYLIVVIYNAIAKKK